MMLMEVRMKLVMASSLIVAMVLAGTMRANAEDVGEGSVTTGLLGGGTAEEGGSAETVTALHVDPATESMDTTNDVADPTGKSPEELGAEVCETEGCI